MQGGTEAVLLVYRLTDALQPPYKRLQMPYKRSTDAKRSWTDNPHARLGVASPLAFPRSSSR